MALRDQPYLPLYIQDVLTDEKLIECSAEAHGVYFRLLCILHKQPLYGKLEIKQKYKQNLSKPVSKIEAVSQMLLKQLPFSLDVIKNSIEELTKEDVLYFEGDDFLCQKRMVKDGEISEKRRVAGAGGGKISKKQAKDKQIISNIDSKIEANSEDEDEIENIETSSKGGMGGDELEEPEIPEKPKEPEEQEEPEDPDTDNFIRKLYIGTFGKEPLPGDYETVKNMLKTYNYDQQLIKAAFRAGFNAKGGQLSNNYVYGILTNSKGDIKNIGNGNQKSKGSSGKFGNTGNRGGGSFASRIAVTEDGDDNEFKIIKAGID
jgi:DNA replication protein DnaD